MELPAKLQQRVDQLPRRQQEITGRTFDLIDTGTGPGNSPPVVLLHGVGSGVTSWLYQCETLRLTHRVVAWNAPGYGATTPLDNPTPNAADYAHALAALLSGLNIATAHIVGQSLGAIMAAAYSDLYPERVQSLTLLNPACGHGHSNLQQREAMRDGRLNSLITLGAQGNALERAPTQLGNNPSPEALAMVRWNLSHLNIDGYRQAVHLLATAHLPDFASYSGPVQVLSGTADQLVATETARATAAAYAQHQFITLDGLGHAGYLEAPALVNQHLVDFFAAAQAT